MSENNNNANVETGAVQFPAREGSILRVLPGFGQEHIPLPDLNLLVASTFALASTLIRAVGGNAQQPEQMLKHRAVDSMPSSTTTRGDAPGSLAIGSSSPFVVAEVVRLAMAEMRFEHVLAAKFDSLLGAVAWAQTNKGKKLQAVAASLGEEARRLRAFYGEALNRVFLLIAAERPDLPEPLIVQAAVASLDQQLIRPLEVLSVWGDAFVQDMHGLYPQAAAITFAVQHHFALFTGQAGQATAAGARNAEGGQPLPTNVFKHGNVFVTRFGHSGPAIVPAFGPLGAHALQFPHHLRHILGAVLTIASHEFHHILASDLNGYAKDLRLLLEGALHEAKAQVAPELVKFGSLQLNLFSVIANMFIETINEIAADIAGGILLSGPAYAKCMLAYFGALNAGDLSVLLKRSVLRSGAHYVITGPADKPNLEFGVHPPDHLRLAICAAALSELGFAKESAEVVRMADQLAGGEPTFYHWSDASGKSKDVLALPVAEVMKVVPILVRHLIQTPLNCLGNRSHSQMVNWTPAREAKAQHVAGLLVAEINTAPTSIGDVLPNYISAGAIHAVYQLVERGVTPLLALLSVSQNAMAMINHLRQNDTAFVE